MAKKTNKGLTFPAEILTPAEVRKLILTCPRRSATGPRNRALIVVMWRAGLRCSEALSLRVVDANAEQSSVYVMRGKGGKSRTVGIDPESFAIIEQWLMVRDKLSIPKTAPLFCTLAGGGLSTAYVRAMLPRLAKRAGIVKRVHAHMLRHTMAAEMRETGEDIAVISKQLGHSNIATTARYLDHVSPTAIINTMKKRHWSLDG